MRPRWERALRRSRNAAVVAWMTVLPACGRTAQPGTPVADTQATADLAALLEATRPFRDLDAAVAAGYTAEVSDCIVHEHHGAMGYHHINRSHIVKEISVDRPQMLLYERLPAGEYRLNGVEFIVPFRFWPRDSTPPWLMGRPMKPEDTFQYWYTHVWVWKDNPDGLFADFHPAVQCAESARKVYRPNPR